MVKEPWLVWLSGLSTSLPIKRWLAQFLVRAFIPVVVGQVPGWERARGNLSMYLSHINVSLPLSCFKFFKKIYYLFIFRDRGREGERKRET